MKIAFIVNHPTQFEVPFYQWVHQHDIENKLIVFYLKNQDKLHYDRELKKEISWGFDLYEGYPFYFLDARHALTSFENYLEKLDFDLVIINGYKNQYQGFYELCKKKGIKTALKLDTVLFNLKWWQIILRQLLLRPIYHQYDKLFITGKVSEAYLLKMGVPLSKIHTFSYCTDNDLFGRSHPLKNELIAKHQIQDKKVILSVAKFMKRESPWDILKAFALLNNSRYCLILIGDGEEREKLENFAKSYPHLTIIFTGYVNYIELPAYYQLSDTFIHAAQDEPWGVSVQEALAGGCTVVCSDKVGAAKDLIEHNLNGFTYTFGHPEELKTAIEASFHINPSLKSLKNKEVLGKWSYATMWSNILESIT
ncbi:glycosyltransferase family 4 protein [Pedobacter glucosidilyticus]|uniref:glycosyltransferase family 4 protein n=1 Tax=Pedobacter glucosidilyticus TaxID=1122941 RepID=UPI00040EF0B3|nr:glycosyltransferase family 4 protein [Pedobacter glucosidilyticus]